MLPCMVSASILIVILLTLDIAKILTYALLISILTVTLLGFIILWGIDLNVIMILGCIMGVNIGSIFLLIMILPWKQEYA